IPEKYIPGHIIKGMVTKLTNFGAFVELEPDLEGLLHISELADHKIEKTQDVVKLGDKVEVKILRVDVESRKIGLSLRRAQWAAEEQAAEGPQQQSPTDVETIATDGNMEEVVKPQEQGGEAAQGSSEPMQPGEQGGEPVESEGCDVEEQKETAESEQTEAEQTEESAQADEQCSDDSSAEEKSGADTDN
ncbi:hypothetical protein LCGC14_1965180, partial [marine sediment metagenome]